MSETGGSPPARMVFVPVEDPYVPPIGLLRRWARAVTDAVPQVETVVLEPGDDPAAELARADAVFGMLTAEMLQAAPQLRWLQAPAAAPPDRFYSEALIAHPVEVTNLRGVYRDNVADHVMAFVLAWARGLPGFWDAQRARTWRNDLAAGIADLSATVMVLVGVGTVGSAVAARARPFGITLVGIDARPGQVAADLDELHGPAKLDDVLGTADWVVITVPDTPDTHRFISRERLGRMKPGSYLINVGRGGTVDLDALVAALDGGPVAGAALDVFEAEPLPADHPLWARDDAILTPHVAGYGHDTDAEREALIVENARRFAAGEPLLHVIDKRLRY